MDPQPSPLTPFASVIWAVSGHELSKSWMRGLPPHPSFYFLLPLTEPLRIRNLAVSGHELSKSWMRGLPPNLPAASLLPDLDLTPRLRIWPFQATDCPNLTAPPRIRNLAASGHELSKSWMRGPPNLPALPTYLLPPCYTWPRPDPTPLHP